MTTDSQIDAVLAVFRDRMPDVSPSREIMREAIEAAEKAAWRPIGEAPKDGAEINAYRADHGVFTCRWSTMEELVAHDEAGDPIEDYNEDQAGWWHDRFGWLERDLTPTRFRPLPSPPEQEP